MTVGAGGGLQIKIKPVARKQLAQSTNLYFLLPLIPPGLGRSPSPPLIPPGHGHTHPSLFSTSLSRSLTTGTYLPFLSSRPVPEGQPVPFRLLDVPCDEVVVHIEQANPQKIEDDIQAMAQRHGFVVSLAERSQSSLLTRHTVFSTKRLLEAHAALTQRLP